MPKHSDLSLRIRLRSVRHYRDGWYRWGLQGFLIVSFLIAVSQFSATTANAQVCRVDISSPHSGDSVSAQGIVEGVADSLPAGAHLWVFARRSGLAIWWPQGGGELHPSREGNWRAYVTYGQDRDVGSQFELTVIVADGNAHAELLRWFDNAAKTGNYPGILLPASLCNPTRLVTVDRH